MPRFPLIMAGLTKPKTDEFLTCEQMRVAIFHGRRDSALVHNAMIAADTAGWNGEDRYTYLAYHALVALEEQFRARMRLMDLLPNPDPIMSGDGT